MKASSMNKGELCSKVSKKLRIISLRIILPFWFFLPVLAFGQSDPEAIHKGSTDLAKSKSYDSEINAVKLMAAALKAQSARVTKFG